MAEDKDLDLQPEENDDQENLDESGNPMLFAEGETDTVARLKKINITDEMERSYLNYAMSVIVSRALPDVRDGLKPVHRRILYAMRGLGLTAGAKYRKSATVVGEVLGKYHPHGDSAVYESMVRLAQDFAMRYQMVNGQGNFGSIDGDNAAAMRYTEAKMTKIAEEMLADIEKNTVDFRDNYDGSHQEPCVLPAKVPQLLLNGSMGIAVAMATSIPPHNLTEVSNALIKLIENSEVTIDELMEEIKGPDFPTAGIIYDREAIKTMYVTGRGGITVRARTEIAEIRKGKLAIIVTELPYQVNKAALITKMAELVRDKKIDNITDLRDESNREGIRVVIELHKNAYPKKVLNQLYKMTSLQTTFNMNMIALVDGIQPRLLNLKQVLEYFLKHRQEVVTRRTQFDLDKAKARAHILEGLKIALDHIDEVIATIRAAETKEVAHEQLMSKFNLSDLQATAILEMRLQTLAGLERKKIEDELLEKLALIKELTEILADPEKILAIIKAEVLEIKDNYGDARRTEVVAEGVNKITNMDTVPNQPMIVTITQENYIKRMPPSTFKSQKRGGKGVIGLTTKDDDQIMGIHYTMNHDDLMFFTNLGRVFKLKTYEIPEASRTAKGLAIVNLLQLQKNENITSILVIRQGAERSKYLLMATKSGTIKKTAIDAYDNVRKSGLLAMKLRDGDSLEWVKQVNPGQEIVMITNQGKCIRFDEVDAREIGRFSIGVRGIKLKEGDEVVEMDVVSNPKETNLFVVMENGLGKSTSLDAYRKQNRGGTGVLTAKITGKTGKVVGARLLSDEEKGADLLFVSKNGMVVRIGTDAIPEQGRATQGVYIMRFKGDEDKVASMSLIKEPEIDEADLLIGEDGDLDEIERAEQPELLELEAEG
jgi:DNA gyrase subunit A